MLSRSELAVRCHCLSGRSNDAESANETTTIETTTADNCGIIVLKSGSPREQVCQAPGQLKGAQSLVNLIIRSEASLANDAAHSTTGLSARNFKPKSDLRCACTLVHCIFQLSVPDNAGWLHSPDGERRGDRRPEDLRIVPEQAQHELSNASSRSRQRGKTTEWRRVNDDDNHIPEHLQSTTHCPHQPPRAQPTPPAPLTAQRSMPHTHLNCLLCANRR